MAEAALHTHPAAATVSPGTALGSRGSSNVGTYSSLPESITSLTGWFPYGKHRMVTTRRHPCHT
jgi:hypothetical protein